MNESIEVLETHNSRKPSWTRNRLLALCEFGGIALIFWADVHHHIYLSKMLYLFPLAWFSLWLRGLRWTDVGLCGSKIGERQFSWESFAVLPWKGSSCLSPNRY